MAPSEAKQRLDQQRESGEPPSRFPNGRSVAGIVVAVLSVFYTLSLAVLLSMLLAPAVQLLERLRVPRLLVSAVVVLSVVGLLGVGMSALAAPAKAWIDKTAQSLQKLEFARPYGVPCPPKNLSDGCSELVSSFSTH